MDDEIRAQVKERIEREGWKLGAVAERAGLSRIQLYRMLEGTSEGSVAAWRNLLAAVGLKIALKPASDQ